MVKVFKDSYFRGDTGFKIKKGKAGKNVRVLLIEKQAMLGVKVCVEAEKAGTGAILLGGLTLGSTSHLDSINSSIIILIRA